MVEKLNPVESQPDTSISTELKKLGIIVRVGNALNSLKIFFGFGEKQPGYDSKSIKDILNSFQPPAESVLLVRERLKSPDAYIFEHAGIKYLSLPVTNKDDKGNLLATLLERPIDRHNPFYKTLMSNSPQSTLEIPLSEITSGDYVDEIAQLERNYKIEVFRTEFLKNGFTSYPDSTSLEKDRDRLQQIGNQDYQAEYHFKKGCGDFPVITDINYADVVKKLTKTDRMVKVDDIGKYHLLGNIYSEQDPSLPDEEKKNREEMAKHVYAVSYKLLEGMGEAINNDLHNRGMMTGATVKIPIGALIRTQEYSDHLADVETTEGLKKYPYATKIKTDKKGDIMSASSHIIGDAIDATFSKVVVCTEGDICFAVTEEQNPELVRGVRALAVKYLLDNVKKGKALGILEPNNVLHFIGIEERQS